MVSNWSNRLVSVTVLADSRLTSSNKVSADCRDVNDNACKARPGSRNAAPSNCSVLLSRLSIDPSSKSAVAYSNSKASAPLCKATKWNVKSTFAVVLVTSIGCPRNPSSVSCASCSSVSPSMTSKRGSREASVLKGREPTKLSNGSI